MPRKLDEDATTGNKLLRLFRKLMLNRSRHYMSDLARELKCSPQTVGRLMQEIENELGAQIESGMEAHKKWYRFASHNVNSLGFDTEEIRYLSICRDLADPYLSEDIKERIDKTILNMSIKQLGEERLNREYSKIFEPCYSFYAKGKIDYSPYINIIIKLERAIRDNSVLKLEYRSSKSNRIKIICFVPKQFICHNSALYLLGASVKKDLQTYDKQKTLLVHRIESLEKTTYTANFSIPAADLKDFGLPWSDKVATFTIIFKNSSAVNYVKERVWAEDQKLRNLPEGELELTFSTKSIAEVIAWCRGFGDRIKEVRMDGAVIEDIMRNDLVPLS